MDMTRSRIRDLKMKWLQIPFKSAFRHAAADRNKTASVWVEAVSTRGLTGYGESCPRPYVTGETLDTATAFFKRHRAGLCGSIYDISGLRSWMAINETDIDSNPAAWCAIELAILDMLAREREQGVEALLSLPKIDGAFRYSAVVGDADGATFERSTQQYLDNGFSDFKLKLSGDLKRDREKFSFLHRAPTSGIRVRVDANNLWDDPDQALSFLRAIDYPLFAVEEPVRANRYIELAQIATALNTRIVLDESFLRISQLDFLRNDPACWLINLRVSKMGGLLRSLDIIAAARTLRIGLVVGAHVGETSLLTRAALCLAHAAGDGLVIQEGAFGTFLLERDICDPPLMFGAGGVLDTAGNVIFEKPGFGIAPTQSLNFVTAIN